MPSFVGVLARHNDFAQFTVEAHWISPMNAGNEVRALALTAFVRLPDNAGFERRPTGNKIRVAQKHTLWAIRSEPLLGADDLVETLDNTRQIFGSDTRKALPNSFNGERTNLTDFHPRPSRETGCIKFKRQRKACSLRLASQRHSDHGA